MDLNSALPMENTNIGLNRTQATTQHYSSLLALLRHPTNHSLTTIAVYVFYQD